MLDRLIRGGVLIDGTGAPRRTADVGIRDGRIAAVGRISEAARDSNIEVTWYRNRSNPVGLFKFYADQARPSAQIMTFEVKDGKITVAGRSFDESSPGLAGYGN